MKERLTPEERHRQREQEPAEPLSPDANDPRAAEPHHALNNPATDPDPTEYPDPYEKRPDPRGPDDEERAPDAPSTSEPHPPQNYDELKPVKGDRED
jgi:hypothetical protein